MYLDHVLSNLLVISVFTEMVFFLRHNCQFTDTDIFGQCSKKPENTCLFQKKEFAELQIRLFCVEYMSPDPTAPISAFESNVPILKGLGSGVTMYIWECIVMDRFWKVTKTAPKFKFFFCISLYSQPSPKNFYFIFDFLMLKIKF